MCVSQALHLIPHSTTTEVAETPSQRAGSALAVLGDEFRIAGVRQPRGCQSVQVALTPSE